MFNCAPASLHLTPCAMESTITAIDGNTLVITQAGYFKILKTDV